MVYDISKVLTIEKQLVFQHLKVHVQKIYLPMSKIFSVKPIYVKRLVEMLKSKICPSWSYLAQKFRW